MQYFIGLNYSVCLQVSNNTEFSKLSNIFPSGNKLFEAENLEEVFEELLSSVRCREKITSCHLFEIVNTDNELVFAFLGTEQECQYLKKFFKFGSISHIILDSEKRKLTLSKTMARPPAIKRRIDTTPNFLTNYILSKGVDINHQPACVPEEYVYSKDVEKAEKLKTAQGSISLVNRDTTYETDEVFSSVFKVTDELDKLFSSLESQKNGLKNIIRACDFEILNLLHELELNFDKVSASKGYNISKKIHEVRQCRRRAKDKLEVIATMETVFDGGRFKTILDVPDRLAGRKYSERSSFGMFDEEKVVDADIVEKLVAQVLD